MLPIFSFIYKGKEIKDILANTDSYVYFYLRVFISCLIVYKEEVKSKRALAIRMMMIVYKNLENKQYKNNSCFEFLKSQTSLALTA